MKNNELEWMFISSNIDFISLAAKFLNDKKRNRELLARLCELKGTNCDDISDKIALLIVECVVAELMREHDEKLFENVESKKKKKKKKMSNPIEELMSVVTDEQVKEDKSYSWKAQTVEQCVKRKDLWKIPRKGGHVSKYWDYVTGGAIKGEVHMLVAPSGGGKTRTGIEVACNLLDEGWKVCYLTFEQTKEEIYEMVLLHYADGDYTMAKSDMTWELIKDKVFAVREFENDDKDRVIDMLNHLGNYDALVLDYVAPPDNCPLGGPEMSTTMRLMCKGIKDAATKNNQYVFCMAQGRDAQPPKGIDGDVPFSDVSDIWCSAQMITPLNVVCIQKSSRFDANEKFLDFVKVRKPLNGVSKCRIVRKYDFAALKSEDTQLRDICGGVINGYQGVQTSAANEAAE